MLGYFTGETINTPSMLAVEDYIDALAWADSVGGVPGLIKRSQDNYRVLEAFVNENSDWIDFMAKDPLTRSTTSVCFRLNLNAEQIKKFMDLLDKENVAYDINSYPEAPPSIRIWCGSTVEKEDLEALTPWLKWAYEQVKEEHEEKVYAT